MTYSVFENASISLAPHLRCNISIPFESFQSDCAWEEQPVTTSLECEIVCEDIRDWRSLSGRRVDLNWTPEDFRAPYHEASLYLGCAHNCIVKARYEFGAQDGLVTEVLFAGRGMFEEQGVGPSVHLQVAAEVEMRGLTIEAEILNRRGLIGDDRITFLGQFIDLSGYEASLRSSREMPRVTFYDPDLWLWLPPKA